MKQFVRYTVIGVISNLTGYLVYLFLTGFSIEPKLAMTLVYATGATVGFFGNKQWTFMHKGKIMPTFLKYFYVHGCGYSINYIILYFFVDKMVLPHEIVQAFAILVVAVFLFFSLQRIVFLIP